jgi:hypothetical protein
MSALPQPEHGGSIDELRDFLNVASDGDFALCVSWAVAALRHQGPYPILCLHGEQGAAKTTVARMLRALIDPNAAPVRAEPRDPRDLAISATNGWIIAMDNLSSIRPWLSDALCRLSTGGGWVTRALYTDSDEIIFDAQRPILITGISEVATRGDLLDRSILLTLPAISEEARAPESELWARFNEASPRLLGALLDGVVSALRHERDVSLDQTPRMADFARWSVAAENAYPWPAGTFLLAYRHNRRDSHEISLEASPVASEVRRLLTSVNHWKGTAQELLETLKERAPGEPSHLRAWPKSPRSLSATLRRLAPNLRAVGIEVEFYRTSGGGSKRLIALQKRGDSSVASVASDASGDAHRPDRQSGDGGVASVANAGRIQPSKAGELDRRGGL